MPAMTMTEKILARAAGKPHVEPGERGRAQVDVRQAACGGAHHDLRVHGLAACTE